MTSMVAKNQMWDSNLSLLVLKLLPASPPNILAFQHGQRPVAPCVWHHAPSLLALRNESEIKQAVSLLLPYYQQCLSMEGSVLRVFEGLQPSEFAFLFAVPGF